MRVLHVSRCGALGGAERTLLELCAASAPLGMEALLACPVGPLALRAASAGIRCFTIPASPLGRPRSPRAAIAAAAAMANGTAAIARFIARTAPDLVHANTTPAQLWAGPAARLRGIPCVWHWRDLHDLPRLHRALKRTADAIIATSDATFDAARAQLGSRAKLVLVRNGVAELAPPPAGAALAIRSLARAGERDMLVLAAGQSIPRKGHRVLARAMADPRLRGARVKALLVCAELGPEDALHTRALRREIQALGCADMVTIAPGSADIGAALAAADLVAVPSLSEPFGRVAVEAMLAERPVIASAVGGLCEIVTHGLTGLLVHPDAPTELAAAIVHLAARPELCAALGNAGRCEARARFSTREMAEGVREVYASLFGKP